MADSIGADGWQPDVALPPVDIGYVSDASSQYEGDELIILQYKEKQAADQSAPTDDVEIPDEDHELGVSQTESVWDVDHSVVLGYQGTPPPATQISTTNSTDVSSRNSSATNVFSSENVLGKRKMSGELDTHYCTTKMAKVGDSTMEPSNAYIIAHDASVQRLLSDRKLSHALLYELARLVSQGVSYDAITDTKLQELLALKNISSSKIDALFKDRVEEQQDDMYGKMFALELAATSPWEEIKREEEALAADPDAGVGNNTSLPGWYGGKVIHSACLVEAKDPTGDYGLRLDPQTLGPSCRITRMLGSFSIFRVRVPDKILHAENNNLEAFFQQRFILWDKVYRAIYAKDGTVFLLWTNEIYLSKSKLAERMSFEQFFDWYNPVSHNGDQLMTKWAARTALGFSNSVPSVVLSQEDMLYIDDEMSPDGKSDMTDGCGFTSKHIHIMIAHQLNLPIPPAAVQFRLGGCKGMTVLRYDEKQDNTPRAWLRSSQTKIRYPPERRLCKAQRTIDILRTSRLKTSTRLSNEVIINLHENGVPPGAFTELMKQSVCRVVNALTTWDGPDAMAHLWMNVERAESVLSERRAREAKGEARVRGAKNTSIDDGDEDDDEREDEHEPDLGPVIEGRSAPWWPDDISGCPSTLGETVMALLDSGFRPQHCAVLREKLKNVLDNCVKRETTRLRFEVPESCNAFAVPDPCGVLGEDEIQVKSSRREFKLEDGMSTDTLSGDVLITRNPCKVPSDTRKVKAVDHPALHHLTDVVVFSTKGNRRLIDFLAGGDYDGDTVIVFWNQLIVKDFRNADDKYSHEPAIVETCFTRDMEKGNRFVPRLQKISSEEDRIKAYQAYLLGALRSTFYVGKYSTWHDNAIYKLGYGDPDTHALAAKFCRVLDSAKTGYRIKPEVYREDKRKFDHPKGPRWKTVTKGKKKEGPETSNLMHLARNKDVEKDFIMDILIEAAHKEWNRTKKEMDATFSHDDIQEDPHLAAPWREAIQWQGRGEDPEWRKQKKKELSLIALHVHKIYNEHAKLFSSGKFQKLPASRRQDYLRDISKKFASSPTLEEVSHIPDERTLRRWRASYAYIYDREQKADNMGFSRFPFNVAMRELCSIKADSLGATKVVTDEFYQKMRLDRR